MICCDFNIFWNELFFILRFETKSEIFFILFCFFVTESIVVNFWFCQNYSLSCFRFKIDIWKESVLKHNWWINCHNKLEWLNFIWWFAGKCSQVNTKMNQVDIPVILEQTSGPKLFVGTLPFDLLMFAKRKVSKVVNQRFEWIHLADPWLVTNLSVLKDP